MATLDAEFEATFDDQVRARELAKLNELSALATRNGELAAEARSAQNMSLRELFEATVRALVGVITDLSEGKPLAQVFLARDRALYVGLVLIALALAVWLCGLH